jgi:cytochrome c peroxidase
LHATSSKSLVVLSLLAVAGCAVGSARKREGPADDVYLHPPAMVIPEDNQMSSERILLGRTLFFDPRLSGSRWISCATCHHPGLGWSDALPVGIGVGMRKLKRATPTLVNVAYARILQWDGSADTLENEVLRPLGNKDVMDMDLPTMVERLSNIEGYRPLFEQSYPAEGITQKTVMKALAAFERTIVSIDTPFDRWRHGDDKAVRDSAKRGFELFRGKANCAVCHDGFNFTDDGFHNIGLKTPAGMPEDEGRYAQRKIKSVKGAFKTPTLREIELTAPYMHNGIYTTLEEVVDHYDRGGDVTDNLDPNIRPLHLTAGEKHDLIEFLKSLTSPRVDFPIPRLPQ